MKKIGCPMGSLLLLMKGGEMAKAKYEEWILEEGLLNTCAWKNI